MIAMHCDEEILQYLKYIKETWHKILREDTVSIRKVDQATVKALELTAPGACTRDAETLYGQFKSGRIFGAFSEPERESIWKEVLSCSRDRLIPSLFTLFEDLKYLQDLADSVKHLLHLSPRDTVFSAFENSFSDARQVADQYVIQMTESTFAAAPGSSTDRIHLGIRQIWIAAMRDYLEMPAGPKKADSLAKPGREKANEVVLYRFASLASRLGFNTKEIRRLTQRSPEREIARDALLKARKPDQYRYDKATFEGYVEQMLKMFDSARPVIDEPPGIALVANDSDKPVKRCGIPRKQEHNQAKWQLFLRYLHEDSVESNQEMTSFFVRRSVYFAFFGKPTSISANVSTMHEVPQSQIVTERRESEARHSAARVEQGQNQAPVAGNNQERSSPLVPPRPEQERSQHHPNTQPIADPSPPNSGQLNQIGDTRTSLGDSFGREEIAMEEADADWESDQEMLDGEEPAVLDRTKRESLRKKLAQKTKRRRKREQNKATRKSENRSTQRRHELLLKASTGLMGEEQDSTPDRQTNQDEQTRQKRVTQINLDEVEETDAQAPIQVQAPTASQIDSLEKISEMNQFTATQPQGEDQDIVTESVVHEVATSEIPTLDREVSLAEAEGRREAQEQHTAEQTYGEPDERQTTERTQDGKDGNEGQQVNQGKQEATERERGQHAAWERIDEAQATPPREIAQTEDSPPRDQVLLDEAEQESIDNQMRRDREESLFSPESMSPMDESTNVETAPQRRIETAPQQEANGSVNGIEGTPPMLIVDQQHELSPAQQVNAATEEVERISTAEMKDSAEREAIPTLPQSEILGRGQEKLEELGGRVSQDQEHYDEIGLEQRKRKTPDLDSGPAIEGPSQLQDLKSPPKIREPDRKRVTQINFGRLEELESLERAHEMLSPGHDRDGVRDGGELIAREDEILPDVQEELRGDDQARYEPLPGEANRAAVENTERIIDDRLRERENEETAARARKKAAIKEVERRRQERVRQLKNEKPELMSEQKMTRERARDQQERQVKEDEGMRRKRTTQIDFGRLGDAVHGQPKPKESTCRRPITKKDTGDGPAEVVVLDSDVIATTNQQPADPPKLTTERPGPQKIRIHLKISDGRLGGEDWKSLSSHDVDPSEPADFMRFLRKYTRKDTENPWNVFAGSHMITPLTKFEDIIKDGNSTLYITREGIIDTHLHPNSPAGKRIRS
ncbi:hypothetical protein LTR96_010867 [Exophiala xenobiotica]|nr:hypothetical protein LTR92_011141 [Exophiala xenobiotica]KAK5215925.1 hypothetical protein LTR72_011050 [Exophiala xenobiotica]KAK5222325.1 hypothetical protein LTR47_010639 [Exophiala xenobiotica]KAK5246936.1 hypothetical protein LTS06_007855 [Exophiala xenobiotica]KAK5263732.1 hypothetical protein LTR96_010867 [Exophiala xenobiotica]